MRSTITIAVLLVSAFSLAPAGTVAAQDDPEPETTVLASANYDGSGWFAVRYEACEGPILLDVTTTDLSPALATGLYVLDAATLVPHYGLIRNSLTGSGQTVEVHADGAPAGPLDAGLHLPYTFDGTNEETAEITPAMHGGEICGTYVMVVFVAADHLGSMELAFRAPSTVEVLAHTSGDEALRLTARHFEQATANAYAQATVPVIESQRGTILAPAVARATVDASYEIEVEGTLIGYYGDSLITTGADVLSYEGPEGHRDCGRLSNLPDGISPAKCVWFWFDEERAAAAGSYTYSLTGAGAGSHLTAAEVYLIAADIVLP